MLKWVLAVTFIACFLCFTWAIYFLFDAPSGMPRQMRWLGGLGLTCFCSELIGIAAGDPRSSAFLGETLLVCSLVLFWYSVVTVRDIRLGIAYAQIEPKSLVRAGPYRWVRHPFYSAYILFWLGGVVATASPPLIVVPIVMGIYYFLAAKAEEKQLLDSKFGYSYADYIRRTGMFLPLVCRPLYSHSDGT
jgi:protein-S-isoprenylcysteine O-methyltransferase Ste14